MDTLALRAASCLGQSATASRPSPQGTRTKRPGKRAPRTRAAAAVRSQAIEAAVTMLREARIAFIESVPGKLIVEPRAGVAAAQIVTFWPARERLRLGSRRTKRGQDIRAFEHALLDQGHHVPGYSVQKSSVFLHLERDQAERIRRWLERQAHLQEVQLALDACISLNLQRLKDIIAGRRLEDQNHDRLFSTYIRSFLSIRDRNGT